MQKSKKILGALLMTALVLPCVAKAKVVPLDHVAAIVNNDVIMASEVDEDFQQVKQQLLANRKPIPPQDVLEKQILERIILDRIQVQLGLRAGIDPKEEEVTKAIADIAARGGLTVPQFYKTLAAQNQSPKELRQKIRDQLIIAQIRRQELSQDIKISERDVTDYLKSYEGHNQLDEEYRLGHILIATPDGASATQIQKAKAKAEAIIHKLRANHNSSRSFAKLAMSNSAGQNALKGGDLGWRKQAALPSLFARITPELKRHEIAGPIRNASGYHIIMLLDKKGLPKVVATEAKLWQILLTPTTILSPRQAQIKAQKIYEELQASGAKNFALLAKKYSSDLSSKQAGGDMGWVDVRALSPHFQTLVKQALFNQVQPPFKDQSGFHIIKVTARRKKDVSSATLRAQIKEFLFMRRFEEKLESWLQRLRAEAYINIKS